MTKNIVSLLFPVALFLLPQCHGKDGGDADQDVPAADVQTPVTVTSVSTGPLTDYAELNATSVFQQDNIVKSNINGYIKTVNGKIGGPVDAGQVLFILKTKEAESLGNTINQLDSSFRFSGVNTIRAPESGFITEMPHQAGDYVQDGEQLAVISNSKSFGFLLNLPYEMRRFVQLNKQVEVILPDSTHLQGWVSSFMPVLDSVSQTQQVLVKTPTSNIIPENLVVKVRIVKTIIPNTQTLPRQAVMSDESQQNFWIMKMIDSVTAVKLPITKGMEIGDRVEIKAPQLGPQEKILLTGNYGLPDTAKVKILKSE